MNIKKEFWGRTQEGEEISIYILENTNGMSAKISDFGGIVVSLMVPDKNGRIDDVVLGYDKPEDYFRKGPYFGAAIGRHANRIEGAVFELNGTVYNVAMNDGKNHLHGGNKGFDKVLWNSAIIYDGKNDALELIYLSKDGEENYPGNLEVKIIYALTDKNELKIDYYAVSNKDTVVNLTNHSYFNLSGHSSGTIREHYMMINADKFTAINDECIPTGEIREVTGTPMDFTRPVQVGKGLESTEQQIAYGQGYDHNWILNVSGKLPEKAVEVIDYNSGRALEVYTTKPGVQFYSGNFLDGSRGKGGAVYDKWAGLCLETQYFPNSLKHAHFPSSILRKNEEYRHTTIYKLYNL